MKHKMWSRLLSMALAVMMISSIVPNSAFAEAASEITNSTSQVQVEETPVVENDVPQDEVTVPEEETPVESVEPTAEPTADPMAEPTAEPTQAPEATAVPSEQPSTEPTAAPEATETPNASAQPSESPAPSATPAPSASPLPSETPVPTETPAATEEPAIDGQALLDELMAIEDDEAFMKAVNELTEEQIAALEALGKDALADYTLRVESLTAPEETVELNAEAKEFTTVVEGVDGVTVTVKVPEGALPVDAELKATMIDQSSKEYAKAERALEEKEETYDGMVALDIRFEVGDQEVEPLKEVEVSIDAQALLPEDADPETVAVQHLKEEENGIVTVENVEAAIEADTMDTSAMTATFRADDFSIFTVSWMQAKQAPEITVTIFDEVKTTGNIVANVSSGDLDTYEYVWYRRVSGTETNWEQVMRTVVSGSEYNYTRNQLNVALDHEVAASGRDSVRYEYKVTVKNRDEESELATSEVFSVPYYTAIQNGSFEVSDTKSEDFVWRTTASNGNIELGMYTDEMTKYGTTNDKPTSDSGNYFAELNADEASSLYQDVLTVPGTTLNWQIAHRARNGNGGGNTIERATDTMYVVIMSTIDAEKLLAGVGNQQAVIDEMVATVLPNGGSVEKAPYELTTGNNVGDVVYITIKRIQTYSEVNQKNIGTWWWPIYQWVSENQWDIYRDNQYIVPERQYATRFFFAAGPTQTNNATVGNLIDGVWFSTNLPPADPNKGNLTVEKVVEGIEDEDLTGYQVEVTIWNKVTGEQDKQVINQFVKQQDGSHKGSVSFANIETGQYQINEEVSGLHAGYELIDASSTKTVNVDIEDQQTITAVLKNVYQGYGTIKVTKTFVGLTPEQIEKLEDTLTFTFTNTEDESLEYSIGLNQMQPKSDEPLVYEGEISNNVKIGSYTAAETGADTGLEDYELATTLLNNPVTVTAGDTAECAVTNTYTEKVGSLEIVKTLDKFGEAATFLFEIKGNEGQGTYYTAVEITKNDVENGILQNSTVINNLPAGDYTVTEILCPNGYEINDASSKVVKITGGKKTSVTFLNKLSTTDDPTKDSGSVTNRFTHTDDGWTWNKQ